MRLNKKEIHPNAERKLLIWKEPVSMNTDKPAYPPIDFENTPKKVDEYFRKLRDAKIGTASERNCGEFLDMLQDIKKSIEENNRREGHLYRTAIVIDSFPTEDQL